jgi:cyclopropane-fatty-acyl-phospholipid synthase
VAKKRHIAAKLHCDRPGLKVLDIGCGWGGLALDLARDCKANVLGVTLSEEQLAVARARAAKAHLEDSCRFELVDYRKLGGQFDRIVSVGMFEHVGVPYYQAYFDTVRELLTDDGVALIHTIGRSDGAGATNPWIRKYIFPGGYTPALSEMLPVIEKAGLMVSDVEVLRLHYAETLKEWRRRFKAHWNEAAQLYDERFCRMWEFYLAGSEMGFRHEGLVVFQVQLVKNVDALPMTRDYMIEAERTMKFAGTERMPRPMRVA